MKYPGRINATQLGQGWDSETEVEVNGVKRWVPARPMGYASLLNRFRMAWAVFTGKADALFWDQQ